MSTAFHGMQTLPHRPSARRSGAEFRALAWLIRHPLFVLLPGLLVAGAALWSLWGTLGVTAGLIGAVLLWWRAHPASFDRWLAPRLRASWRRWTRYRGRRWAALLADCGLTREDRRTHTELVPRLLRVRSASRALDTLYVRMLRGQDIRLWTEQAPTLADALCAHRVSIIRHRPAVLAVVVEHAMPFTRPLNAPLIPERVEEVDPAALDIGDLETGAPFLLGLRGKQFLVAGGSGSGKGSLLTGPLRALAPLIRAGLVRVWCIDLKGGVETGRMQRLFHRWATTGDQAVELLGEFRDSMLRRQARLRRSGPDGRGIRQNVISAATQWELLVIDELAMLTAYGQRHTMRDGERLLGEILTQGRATDHTVAAYVQEPDKDTVAMRDLFTLRLCLAVTSAAHVDMVLGDGARDRGALADEIPIDADHAGIGFTVDPRTRQPIRFRAGMCTDADIDELVTRATPDGPEGPDGRVLPFPTTDTDETGEETAS
jgi:DNA segregation ATPase FtsK/SpoIIIE, S-DNA-T family